MANLSDWSISYVMLGLAGFALGSVCRAIGLQLPRGESLPLQRSSSTCRSRILPPVSLVELCTAFSFVSVFHVYGCTFETLMGLLFVSLLTIVSISDMRYRMIPDKVVLPGLLLFLFLRWWEPLNQDYGTHLLGMVIAFFVVLILALLMPGGVGGGDIKLYALSGLFLGFPLIFPALFLSSFLGALYGAGTAWRNRTGRKTMIPFAPFITAGTLVSYLWGEDLLHWYPFFLNGITRVVITSFRDS